MLDIGPKRIGVVVRDPQKKIFEDIKQAQEEGRPLFMSSVVKKVIGESQEPLEIIEGERPEYYDICPHCKQEIFERHVYFEGSEHDRAFHSDCKGPIIFPRKRIREETAKLMNDPNYPFAGLLKERNK
jgi:hypothetical protein